MSLQWVNRAGVLRHLHLGDALSRPSRVIAVQNQLRRLCISNQPQLTTPRYGGLYSITSQQTNSFATDATRPKTKRSPKASDGKRKSSTAPKKKKELTEKQKEDKKKREEREHIKKLKETALTAPKKLPQTAFLLAVKEKLPEAKSENQNHKETFAAAVQLVKGLAPLEQERFQNQADQNRASNEAAYADWVKSHTPLQIKEANQARRNLAKLTGKTCHLIKDDRLVKRPGTAYIHFSKERTNSGDFKHMSVPEFSVRIRDEWKSLAESQKERYNNLAVADSERYFREYQEVYGELPKSVAKSA